MEGTRGGQGTVRGTQNIQPPSSSLAITCPALWPQTSPPLLASDACSEDGRGCAEGGNQPRDCGHLANFPKLLAPCQPDGSNESSLTLPSTFKEVICRYA